MPIETRHFAFLSRHEPTESQHRLASEQGIVLHPIGDCDAFTVTPEFVRSAAKDCDDLGNIGGPDDFHGVIVVHPAAAMRLMDAYTIGVYRNANRAPIGARPQFEALELHTY